MANNVLPLPLPVELAGPLPLPTDPVPKNFYAEVAKGNVSGHSLHVVSGRNAGVEANTPESIWDGDGIATFATVGEQLSMESDSVNDSDAGVGAQEITLTYLDDTYIEKTEVLETNGTTAVLTVATNILRFISAYVTKKGSGTGNEGYISFTGSALRGAIRPSLNRSLHGLYTIPAGKTGYVIYGYSSVAKNNDAKISVEFTEGDNGIFTPGFPIDLYENSFSVSSSAPTIILNEKSDINPICTSGNAETVVSIVYQILLVDM